MDIFALSASISLDIDGFYTNLDRAQKKFKSFSDSISDLSGKIDKAYSGMGNLLKPAVDGFKAVEGVGKKAGNAITTGLKGFTAAATAVGGFGAAAAKSGMQFDATMSEVSAISGATGQDFDSLRNKALEMGAKTKFSASEAAEAMTYMGMAGWKAGDMISGIEGIMNLAAASGEDLATTSDIVTDALTAFGLQAGDSGHFANIMAVAASNANTNVGMMGETFKYVAPVAGALGYSVDDTALSIGLMANSGIKATQAGTALRSIFTRLSTDAGASSKSLGALGTLTEKLGVEFYNTDGSARDLNAVLMDSRAAWAGLSEEQQITYAKTIAGQEAMSGWLALMNAAPGDVDKLTAALNDCNGAAEKMASTMVDNLQGDVTLMKSAFESLQIAISDSLTPTLREFAQFGQKAMAGLLEGFQGSGVSGFMSALSSIVTNGVTMLSQKAPEFASVSLQFVTALADGILGAKSEITLAASNTFFMLIDGIGSWLSTNSGELVAAGNQIIAVLFSAFLKAGSLISDNIGQFIPLIARAFIDYHDALFLVGSDILGAIARGIVEDKEGIQNMASQAISEMVCALQENASDIIDGGLALLEALAGAIEENLTLIMETGAVIIGKLVEGISNASPGVKAIIGTAVLPHILKIIDTVGEIGGAVSNMAGLVSNALGVITGILWKVGGVIRGLFSLIMAHPVVAIVTAIIAAVVLLYTKCEWFRDGVKAVLDAVGNAFKTAYEVISGAFSGAVEFFSGVVDGIKSAFDGIGEFLGGLFSDAWEMVQGAWDAAVEFFTGIGNGIHEAFESVTSFLGEAFSAAWDVVSGAWEAATGFFGDIWDNIKGAAEKAADKIGRALSDAWDTVTSAWDGATDFFGGIWEDIKGVFGDAWDKFKEIGENIVGGIKDGILGTWDKFTGWVKEKFDGFVGGVKDQLGIHSPSTEFATIGENVINGLMGGMDAMRDALGLQSAAIMDTMLHVFDGLSGMFSAIGDNAMSSLDSSLGAAIDRLKRNVASLMSSIANAAKAALGIHSPSRVFAGIGENMALGLAAGWDDEYNGIKRKIENGLSFGTASVGVNANYSGSSRYGAQEAAGRPGGWGNTTVNIYSPEAVDGAEAARVWKKETQKMAIAYV